MVVKHRWRLCLTLTPLLLLSALLLVPQVRWPLYGWVRGEAFYRGMPTSWWTQDIEAHYVPIDRKSNYKPTWFRLGPPRFSDQVQTFLTRGTSADWQVEWFHPLHWGDPEALPLLLELIQNDSAKIRRVALSGLWRRGKGKPEVISALLKAINDPDEAVRLDAIETLTHVAPESVAKADLGPNQQSGK